MVTVKLGTKTEEKPFPKLMKTDLGTIVLFETAGKGVCIYAPLHSGNTMGRVCDWSMSYFTDYNEPVTLQNA